MHLALLGTGMIVKEVLPVLQTISGIELEAILSTPRSLDQAQALAETYQIGQATSDFSQVLANPAVDTVYIGTPNHTHYAYAKQALQAGKHVICEKPFTMEAWELDDLQAEADKRELILLEAITNQYLPNFRLLRDNLAKIGQPKILSFNYSQYSSRYDAFKKGEIAPVFNPAMGGGALRDLNIYNIHLLVGLFGKPARVDYLANLERGVDTSGILALDYTSFKAVSIGAKDCSAEIRSTIQGDKGSLTILGPTNSLPKIQLTLNGQDPIDISEPQPQHRMFDEFLAFEAIIAKKDRAKSQEALEHSRAVMAVLEEAVKFMS